MLENSFLRSVFKLPILTLIGAVIFIVFLLYSIAKGFIAAAAEFGSEFNHVFLGFSGLLIIAAAVILIVAGLIMHWRNKSLRPVRHSSSDSSTAHSPEPATAPEQEEEVVEEPPQEEQIETPADTAETEEPAKEEKSEDKKE